MIFLFCFRLFSALFPFLIFVKGGARDGGAYFWHEQRKTT